METSTARIDLYWYHRRWQAPIEWLARFICGFGPFFSSRRVGRKQRNAKSGWRVTCARFRFKAPSQMPRGRQNPYCDGRPIGPSSEFKDAEILSFAPAAALGLYAG